MLGLDSVARRYGVRPSELLGEDNPFVALSIDFWAHNWAVQDERNPYRMRGRRS